MSVAFQPIQSIDSTLSGSGVSSTATSFDLLNFTLPDGTTITTAMLGTAAVGYGVFEPETPREENFTFTGVTDNGDGSSTLTGVTRGLKFVSDYTQDTALRLPHAGGTIVRLSNTAPFYNEFMVKKNDETIDGIKTFTQATAMPRLDATHTYIAGEEKYLASKAYVDGVALAGAPNASTTQKGVVEEATQAEADARTGTGGTGARLFVGPTVVRATLYHDYAADAGANDTYVITVTPAPTAYATGDVYVFKANTANTGAATLNVNSLGAKTIKKYKSLDLDDNDIVSGSIVTVIYDGTNMQLQNPPAKQQASQAGSENYAATASGNDTYAVTLSPAPPAYVTGMTVRVKADVANTGAASLNVNSLGAKSIKTQAGTDPATGYIAAGAIFVVTYDGTNMVLQSPPATPVTRTTVIASRDMTATSGAVTYAHGLGVVPQLIKVSAVVSTASAFVGTSIGTYDGTNTKCITAGTGSGSGTDTTNIAYLVTAAGASQLGVATFDATNVTITWTKGGSPTGTAGILIESFA